MHGAACKLAGYRHHASQLCLKHFWFIAMRKEIVAFGKWYDQQIEVRPLATKALTSSVLAALSSVVAQVIRRKASIREVVSFTLQAAPPFSHFWFELLEAKLGPGKAALKTTVDQLLFRPIMIWYCFVFGGFLSGKRWTEVKDNLHRNFAKVVVSSWKVWPAAMWLTHRYIPAQYRSAFTEMLAFFWDVYESLMVSGAERKSEEDEKEQRVAPK
ncbi:PXMP2/4 family protein 3 [Durusdinium trenchii]|uniref:PXMP2/4 family protein 3 n=1 Tax=Durusdinium trenchii TaxID=1381693 RepID=A0ABP0J6E3_9DINO